MRREPEPVRDGVEVDGTRRAVGPLERAGQELPGGEGLPGVEVPREAPDEPVDLVLGRDVEELVAGGQALPDDYRR